jgi:hypothetical protein
MRTRTTLAAVGFIAVLEWSPVLTAQTPSPPAATPAPPPSVAPTSSQASEPPAPNVDILVQAAQAGAAEAALATTSSEAKAPAGRASDAAKAVAGMAATPAQKSAANSASNSAQDAVAKKQAAESLCSAVDDSTSPKAVCLVYGLFAASLSVVSVNGEGSSSAGFVSGESSHHLTSIAVPFAGIRFLPQVWFGAKSWGVISLDIAGYSAFLTQNLGATGPAHTKVSCSSTGSDFVARLPCEADAPVIPYVGAYLGITFGQTKLAYVSLIPFTVGLAQVGSTAGLRGYTGWSVGALQINGSL